MDNLPRHDVLGTHVPVAGVPDLRACEIETKETIERSTLQIREEIRWFLNFADITAAAGAQESRAPMRSAALGERRTILESA